MLVDLDTTEVTDLFKFYEEMRNVFKFAHFCWGLVPQKVKPEYEEPWKELQKAEWDDWERLRKEVKPIDAKVNVTTWKDVLEEWKRDKNN